MSIRSLFLATAIALTIAPALAGRADPAIDMIWGATTGSGATGASAIDAEVGDVLTLRVFADPGANGISFASISLEWDPAVLQVLASAECPGAASIPPGTNLIAGLCNDSGPRFYQPIIPGVSVDAVSGTLSSVDPHALLQLAAQSSLDIASIDFEVLAPATGDTVDVLYLPGLDSVNDGLGSVFFPSASAMVVPEPGAPLALVFGGGLIALLGRRRARASGAVAPLLIAAALLAGPAAHAQDADGDGVPDPFDNCLLVPNAGPLFCDSDQDGYGNACDADYSGNFVAGTVVDVNIFLAAYGSFGFGPADHDCDGIVGGPDHAVLYSAGWPALTAPGPSGLACAGTPPCP